MSRRVTSARCPSHTHASVYERPHRLWIQPRRLRNPNSVVRRVERQDGTAMPKPISLCIVLSICIPGIICTWLQLQSYDETTSVNHREGDRLRRDLHERCLSPYT
eukprot:55377-Eustigmatos_ZCMA.PRE.1